MQDLDMYKIAEILLHEHGARMTRKHKSEFREFIADLSKSLGYDSKVENCFLAKNVVVGNPSEADIVLTAHYDTAPNMPYKAIMKQVVGLGIGTLALTGIGMLFTEHAINNCGPEAIDRMMDISMMISSIPMLSLLGYSGMSAYIMGFAGGENQCNYDDNTSGVLTLISLMDYYKNLLPEEKKKIAFVFFDNEEKGLVGSLCYRARHSFDGKDGKCKRVKDQNFINFDCVGVGKRINLCYTGREVKPLAQNIAESFDLKKRDGYSLNFYKTDVNAWSDHVPFIGAKGNVMILCDDENDKLRNHIHSKKDAKLVLDNIGMISNIATDTINNILGINESQIGNDRNALDVTGTLISE